MPSISKTTCRRFPAASAYAHFRSFFRGCPTGTEEKERSMTTTFKRKAANITLAGIVACSCAGAATTVALAGAATDVSIAEAAAWKKSGSRWWYQDGNSYAKGWRYIKGSWYYFDRSGWMKTGWQSIGGKWYYFNRSGAMKTGWNKVGGKWYYHNRSGAMVTGWRQINGKWYHFNRSGVMSANRWVGNYYLTSSGAMATNRWIGNYHVNASGKWDKTWKPSKPAQNNNNGSSNKPSNNSDGTNNFVNGDLIGDRNVVIENKYYGSNGKVVTFTGRRSGRFASSDNYFKCYGAADTNFSMNFLSYRPSADTYTTDLTFLTHFHDENENQLNVSELDDIITIPKVVINQSALLHGGTIWAGDCWNSDKSIARRIEISCFDFNPGNGTVGIRVNTEGWRGAWRIYQNDTYIVKLI
ncbi:hypothetical protein GMI68_00810 [Eggerthellaceae bacterium zg-886]|uniref:N-acetylmuramoyl-L-alanine amidase family protein n=2 Tax=Xiamenia xianingshaonis TaxID=2682776 RepID=A0ABX0IEX8_9ACTN|nr:hypothetical protein [Xiamenia xianingshaonis]